MNPELSHLALGVLGILQLVLIVSIIRTQSKCKETVQKLEQTLSSNQRNEYDIYLIKEQFDKVVNNILQLTLQKMDLEWQRENLTTEKYMKFSKLFIDETIAQIRNSRLYDRLVNDVFGSEDSLKDYLLTIFQNITAKKFVNLSILE